LYRQIANIAERFSRSTKITSERKQKYDEAVKSFRLPYWDYYRPRDGPTTFPGVKDGPRTDAPYNYRAPWIFTEPQIMVKTLPDDELKPMDNPFLQWKFASGGLSDKEWGVSQVQVNPPSLTSLSSLTKHADKHPRNDSAYHEV
jgi:tyrosinase